VTPATLFRGLTPGDLTGPYISQFFWLSAPFGANRVEQQMRTAVPGKDYVMRYADWLAIQRGCQAAETVQYDTVLRHLRNGRDLGEWVHVDVLFQAYFCAMLILFDLGTPFDAGNPYIGSKTQDGFGTFGGPHIAALMCEVATRALKAVWYQKWFVHRHLRPEAFAGHVHNHLRGAAHYPIHEDLLDSPVLPRIKAYNLAQSGEATYLLPLAFPEGSPLHPSYGAGHATVAGACTTILKAWFDESFVIPKPVVASPDGLSLQPYSGEPLTVGGELNKIASNVAIGRNIAGVHWRSDAAESLKLGEAIAISILRDQRLVYNEDFRGFSLTKFDGTRVTV
jgi:membrane-associated phospholipid phosphatase